ncbi:hypothetical protein Tco_0319688 [Tanacetum coccineum]
MNDYEESAGIQEDSDSDLQSMPDDGLRSIFGFEAADSDDTHDNKASHSAHTSQDDIASAERLSILDHLDHICKEVSYLHSRLGNMESSIVQIVFDEIIDTSSAEQKGGKTAEQTVSKKVQVVGLEGVHEDLQSQTKHISKFSSSFQDMQTQLEHAYKESILPVSETKFNEESAMVLYNPKKDLVDLITTEQDSEDDDDLDKQPFYVVNSRKEATLKITRGDNPLNLIVHPNFRLKQLGFSRWLEVHALASKKSEASNNLLLQSLRAKFQWVINQAKRLGLPPSPELATFGLTVEERNRKG